MTAMIVDCNTGIWDGGQNAGADPATPRAHWSAMEPVDHALVLGIKSAYLGVDGGTDVIAGYIAQHPEKLFGVPGIDPSEPRTAIDDVRRSLEMPGMIGAAVWPPAQDVHPSSSQMLQVLGELADCRRPVFVGIGLPADARTKLEYANPLLWDEVARELPELTIVIGGLGFPWFHETTLLVQKHSRIFADISGIVLQPLEAYRALCAAEQAGVVDKLLFGSGFPHASPALAIEALYSLNQVISGTNLPPLSRGHLRGIVERDALSLLGIARPGIRGSVEMPKAAVPSPTPTRNASRASSGLALS